MISNQENKLEIFKDLMSNDEIRDLIKTMKSSRKVIKTDSRDNEVVIKYLEELLDDKLRLI